MCRHACPVFLVTKMDANTPRGHALILSKIINNLSEWTEDVVDKIYQCSQCGLCKELCEFHWEEDLLIQVAREAIINKGIEPKIVKDLATLLINNGTVYTKARKELEFQKKVIDKKKADVLYFAGSTALYEQPEIVEATAKILDFMKIDWMMFENEGMTGVELFELGYKNEAKVAARNLAGKIRDINPDILITGCAHTYRAFKELYPQWGIKNLVDIQIYHTTEYLLKKVRDGELKLKKNSTLSGISYHDPCQLGRRMKIYEDPRDLLEYAIGEPPVELFHNKNESECCGAGSVMYLTHPYISSKVAERRIRNAIQEDANIIITACPNCKNILTKASFNIKSGIKVLDIAELIALQV